MIRTTIAGGTFIPPGNTTVKVQTKTGGLLFSANPHTWGSVARKMGVDSEINSVTGVQGSFQPVYHVKKRWNALGGTPDVGPLIGIDPSATGSDAYLVQYEGIHTFYYASAYSQFTNKVGSISTGLAGVQWEALAAQAIDTMAPSFGGDMSIINSVLELRDFKRVATSFWGLVGKAKGPRGIPWWDILVGAGKKDSTLQRLSKTLLSYKFGYESLYRDIVSLISCMSGFNQRYSELVRRANTPQQAYFGVNIAGTDTSGSTTEYEVGHTGYSFFTSPRGYSQIIEHPSKGIRYHATLRYRYPLPAELLAAGGRNKALLDRLGVQKNPAIVWNAIPFTFLIDWLVDVGSFLGRLRTDNVRFQFECLDFCHSAKLEKTVTLNLGHNQYYSTVPKHRKGGFRKLDQCTVSTYDRRVGLPPSLLALKVSSGLTPLQVVLGGSLVGARRRRR